MMLTPNDVLIRGFRAYTGLPNDHDGNITEKDTKLFKKIYGSSPSVLAVMWYHLLSDDTNNIEASERGFKSFLIAMYFLWAYPKNTSILSLAFGVGVKEVQGEKLWSVVMAIASLKSEVIVWPEARYKAWNAPTYLVTVDGVDFKTWEPKHPTLSQDKKMMSHKFRKAGWKYEIAIDVYESKVVWISGQHRGGKSDWTIYLEGLCKLIPQGKKVIADRGYGSKETPNESAKVAIPNACDSKELANFKARARCRHETFNGRLKFFSSLNQTYRHEQSKHTFVFEAVVVIVQFQMDFGSPLFEV